MGERLINFRELEAWSLLFALDGSFCGSTRTVYNSWFNGLVHRLAISSEPIQQKVRNLIVARIPLWMSLDHSAETLQKEIERLFTAPMSEVAKHESFAFVCDCLRIDHDTRDWLRAGGIGRD